MRDCVSGRMVLLYLAHTHTLTHPTLLRYHSGTVLAQTTTVDLATYMSMRSCLHGRLSFQFRRAKRLFVVVAVV